MIRKLRPVMSIVRAGMQLRIVCRLQDVEAVDALLLSESKYITILNRHTSAPASGAADAASDIWFEVRVDPEVYRRLEDSVKTISEGTIQSSALPYHWLISFFECILYRIGAC